MMALHDKLSSMPKSSDVSVVTERGQVSIPAHLRKELGIETGQRLLWEKTGEYEIRIVLIQDTEPRGATAMLGFARRFRPTRKTEEWMEELREGES
ncbi:MAG TPA: AbrB/MazE/SpoVT family DNA-binding domain-containing protein [Thermoanaerobaculia bacterium]|jgi:looped-hinge helix DNA binding domain, AbrB family|nr:AbrB/MazE/SpoVT family DNA-binding domain-containing protein [Thermoanaerobaculia bacterium]